MKTFNLILFILFCLCSSYANAQFSAIEVYGGVGGLSVPEEVFINEVTGLQTVGSGENYFLQQQGTRVSTTNTEYESGKNILIGIEGHYAVNTYGSLYAGIRLQSAFVRYSGNFVSSELTTSGPIDTVFLDSGNTGGGNPINICPGNSFNFSNNEPDRAVVGEIGLPFGYRHRLFGDRISLRIQGSINVPFVNRHSNRSVSTEQDFAENCLRFIEAETNTYSAYSLNTFVFRAGGGVDFSLGRSFSLGVLIQQQLNSTIKSSDTFFVGDGRFVSVPQITDLKPLSISLVGRYLIR